MPIYSDYDSLGLEDTELTGPLPPGESWETPSSAPPNFPEIPPIASAPGTDTPPIYGEEIDLKLVRPLVFVPGIMGTELERYTVAAGRKYNVRQVWPPINLATVATGKLHAITGSNVRPATTSNNPLVSGAYDGLISFLTTELGYALDDNLYIFGYNWTQSNKTSGRRLKGFIDAIFASPRWANTPNAERQVDVICHSMGGIVTRSAMRHFGAKVARTIYIASPHYGAPKAFGFLHPKIEKVPFSADFLLRRVTNLADGYDTLDAAIRFTVQGMESAYELLPDEFYFESVPSIADVGFYLDTPVKGLKATYLTNATSRLANTSMVEVAMKFKSDLTAALPGLHYVLASKSEETLDHADIMTTSVITSDPHYGYMETKAPTPNGDGTVPAISADGRGFSARINGSHNDAPNMRLTFWHIALFLRST